MYTILIVVKCRMRKPVKTPRLEKDWKHILQTPAPQVKKTLTCTCLMTVKNK